MLLLGSAQTEGKTRPLKLEDAIDEIRMLFRKTGYLQKTKYHTSLSDTALDDDLVNFVKTSSEKRSLFLQLNLLSVTNELKTSRHPIPITPSERAKQESIEKMNLKDI